MARINNIIKTRRANELIVKLICTGIDIAENLEGELGDFIEMHEDSVDKMKTLYGLTKVATSVVNHNVFIIYKFSRQKEAKDFEISFIRYIKNDGSNIIDAFLITEPNTEEGDEKDEFTVELRLPISGVKALEQFTNLNSVSIIGYPRSLIYRDMLDVNERKVKLLTTDFNLEVMEIMYYIGKEKIIRQVPQKWLDISEVTYQAIVNTQWATVAQNIVKMGTDGFVSSYEGKEISVPLDLMKMDGLKVTVIKHGEMYINTKNRQQVFAPELLLFK